MMQLCADNQHPEEEGHGLMKPSEELRHPINARLRGRDIDTFRRLAFDRGVTVGRLATEVVEEWLRKQQVGQREEALSR